MTHLSEKCRRLQIELIAGQANQLIENRLPPGFNDVCMVILPPARNRRGNPGEFIGSLVDQVAQQLGPDATLITVGETVELVRAHATFSSRWPNGIVYGLNVSERAR